MSGPSIVFLTLQDVLRLHGLAIEDQGGDPRMLNPGLLEAALAMPEQQFGGAYLHPEIPAMAAAYTFHICKNHPFADGKKRAAFAAAAAFLVLNGWTLRASNDEVTDAIMELAAGSTTKEALTEWFARHAARSASCGSEGLPS